MGNMTRLNCLALAFMWLIAVSAAIPTSVKSSVAVSPTNASAIDMDSYHSEYITLDIGVTIYK